MAKNQSINPRTLGPHELYKTCDPLAIPFETTQEIREEVVSLLGQDRAEHSIQFGVSIKQDGYNLYVLGSPGAGKHRFTRSILEEYAKESPTAEDWIYVHNFRQNNKPVAIHLPPGTAINLKKDMEELIEALLDAIPSAFTSEVYQSHVNDIENEFNEKREKSMIELRETAKVRRLELVRSPKGLVFLPVHDSTVIDLKAFEQLPEEEKRNIEKDIEVMQNKLQNIMQQVPKWQRDARDKIRALDTEITLLSVAYLIDDIKNNYKEFEKIQSFLDDVKSDVVDNVDVFRSIEREPVSSYSKYYADPFLRRYVVNVLVDHSESTGAPVIYEDNPTHDNILGRVEHHAQMGTLLTDFTLIKPGALHLANGGYLILDATKLLTEPLAWEALKRCLSSKNINIQSLAQSIGLVHTVSLEPETIPLDIKIILLGNRTLYYLLCEHESDFHHLFKVAADFEDSVERNEENSTRFVHLIASIAKTENLLPVHRTAMARVIEHSSRIAEDMERLEVNLENISDILREADYWAKDAKATLIESAHIQKALDEQDYRLSRLQTRYYDSILKGTTYIETEGNQVGQVNALTVIDLGRHMFGQPSRVTATARAGDGKVLDIEHEAELGGNIHTKAVLILSQYISTHYVPNKTLSVSASVAFEQSYAEIEGDSASVAELCALLSAISGLPLRQELAVTGSIDQHGRIQAVGGVNEKIEGFFEICQKRGLKGDQGVLVPRANITHLMLKTDVIEAVKQEKFHIFPIGNVMEAVEILFAKPAGIRNKQGNFPKNSVNHAVETALLKMSEIAHGAHDAEEKKDQKH